MISKPTTFGGNNWGSNKFGRKYGGVPMVYDVIASSIFAPPQGAILHNILKFHRDRFSRLRETCNQRFSENNYNKIYLLTQQSGFFPSSSNFQFWRVATPSRCIG